MSNESLLLEIHGQLDPGQPLGGLKQGGLVSIHVIIIGDDSELLICSHMIQKGDSKGHDVLPQFSILDREFLLHDSQSPEFPGELKRRQDWIPTGRAR